MYKMFITTVAFIGMCSTMNAQTTTIKEWKMVAGTEKIDMADVAFLIVADDSKSFSVVKRDETIIGGLTEISFDYDEVTPDGITQIALGNGLCVRNAVTISGLKTGMPIMVYTAEGKLVRRIVAQGQSQTLHLGSLPHGTYIIKANNASVKISR